MPDCIQIGTPLRPLRVAIVGAGPAGFHAAMALLESRDLTVEVDLFDRLPTPYGLVRAGVAPDHQKVKSVTNLYGRIGQDPRFAFFGNVELGRDVFVEELVTHYDQLLFATGNESDRRLGVPGEHLAGCLPASVFVGWYNGHPDFQSAAVNLSTRRVVVIGNGNVALDAARILLKDPAELARTDLAEQALLALRRSLVEEVVIAGRRGPLDASFTPAELKELLNVPNVSVRIDPSALVLNDEQQHRLRTLSPKTPARRNYELLSLAAAQSEPAAVGPAGGRVLEFRCFCSPVEFLGDDQGNLVSVLLRDNRQASDSMDDSAYSELAVGTAIISIGFESKHIVGVPYDEQRGTIANLDGRVIDPETRAWRTNQYCTGWAKTGPKGIIATQKVGSAEMVDRMLSDWRAGSVSEAPRLGRHTMRLQLHERGIRWVTFEDWEHIDATELVRGSLRGAPRNKLVSIPVMLDVVEMRRRGW